MYADRHARPTLRPGSLAVALAINAAAVAALLLAAPQVLMPPAKPPITIYTVPERKPPPPEPTPTPQPHVRTTPPIVTPTPLVPIPHPVPTDPVMPPTPPIDLGGIAGGTGTGPIAIDPPKPAVPLLVGPGLDPRYAGLLQPPYPSEERRAEHEGRVVVRVLVGVDGRVKQVELVSATSDAFFRVTRQQALGKWRFKPATRDDEPVEGWREMAVRFELDEG